MGDRRYPRDFSGLNLTFLRTIREVALEDMGEAMSLFALDKLSVQRIARFSLSDLEAVAATPYPLMSLCDNRGFRALVAQIEARTGEARIETSRISAVLQQAASNQKVSAL